MCNEKRDWDVRPVCSCFYKYGPVNLNNRGLIVTRSFPEIRGAFTTQ